MVQFPPSTRAMSPRQQRAEPVRQLLHRHRRLAGVLGQRVIPVRAPCLVRQVSVVMHLEPGGGELAEQAGRPHSPLDLRKRGLFELIAPFARCAQRLSSFRSYVDGALSDLPDGEQCALAYAAVARTAAAWAGADNSTDPSSRM
ncbi:MAG TPA: hypothetical protein VNH17_15335, partial [Streptosporangiaceae bacterium]|nr:hypothetical protein [Streptosporangiaceae bacterium]